MLLGQRTSNIIALMHKLLLQIFKKSPSGEMWSLDCVGCGDYCHLYCNVLMNCGELPVLFRTQLFGLYTLKMETVGFFRIFKMLTPFHINTQCQIQKDSKSSSSFAFHNVSENDCYVMCFVIISHCHKAFEDKGFISNPEFSYGMMSLVYEC